MSIPLNPDLKEMSRLALFTLWLRRQCRLAGIPQVALCFPSCPHQLSTSLLISRSPPVFGLRPPTMSINYLLHLHYTAPTLPPVSLPSMPICDACALSMERSIICAPFVSTLDPS